MLEFGEFGGAYELIGLATLAAAALPRLLARVPVSMPMVFLAVGMVLFQAMPDLPDPDPMRYDGVALHLTEVCVIISLMGAGLALNRPFGRRRWSSTWRLLAVTMPLTVLAIVALGSSLLGLGIAAAVLVAAALAPTDPVLASEVQVSEPVGDPDHDDDEARFALTSEAGLNDGLAFPFTHAAVAISLAGLAPGGWLGEWFLVDVLWRLAVGATVGLLVGRALAWVFFTRATPAGLAERAQGFVALAATFVAYGAAELAEGYGFVAVFVCAAAIRHAEREHGYHGVLHNFIEQVERMITVLVIVLLGGAVSRGLFADLGWVEVAAAAVILLVVRPAAGWLGLLGTPTGPRERAVIAFFGIRGVGSLYYTAYGVQHGTFPGEGRLWAVVGLVVVGSVVLHGMAAKPAMSFLDKERQRAAERDPDPDADPQTTPV